MLVHTLMGEDLDERASDLVEPAPEVRRGDFIHAVGEVSELIYPRDQLAMLAPQARHDVHRQLWPGGFPPPSQRAKGIENRGCVNGFLGHRADHG